MTDRAANDFDLGEGTDGAMIYKFFRIVRKEGFAGIIRRVQNRTKLGSVVWSVYGVKLKANFEDATFRMYLFGGYGNFYWDRLKCEAQPFVFIDVGANQGLYTICAASNPLNVRSYAFEPVMRTYGFLTKNIKLNAVQEKCETHRFAIADKTGSLDIHLAPNHSGAASLSTAKAHLVDFEETETIKTINSEALDELIDDSSEMILVKIDVEGFELTVIRELLMANFAERIEEFFFEVDESWVDVGELKELLQVNGFVNFEKFGEGLHYDILARR